MTCIPASCRRRASGRLSTRKSTSKLGIRTASSDRMTSSSWQMATTRTSGQPPRATNAFGCRSPRNNHYTRGTIALHVGSLARVVVAVTMAVGAVGGTALAQPAGGAESGLPPCAGCVALTLAPQQLSLLPAAVNGLQILVDPSSAASDLGSFLEFIS